MEGGTPLVVGKAGEEEAVLHVRVAVAAAEALPAAVLHSLEGVQLISV